MKKPSTAKLLAKKLRREVLGNWMQFLSIIFIGSIAVTLFMGLEANAVSLENRVNEVYETGNLADLWVTTESYDQNDLEEIKEISGGEVEGRIYYTSTLEGTSAYIVASKSMPTISKPWEIVDSDATLTDDDFFLVDYALSETSAASDTAISVGDEVSITISLSLDDETRATLAEYVEPLIAEDGENFFESTSLVLKGSVNGIMKYPENITVASYNRSAFLISYSKLLDMVVDLLEENLAEPYRTIIANNEALIDDIFEYIIGESSSIFGDTTIPGFSTGSITLPSIPMPYQYVVTLPEGADESAVEEAIEAYFEAKGEDNNLALVTDRSIMPFYTSMELEVSNARNLTYIFPFVFFFVAVLIVLTTTSEIIIKERTQIGALRAIGVSKKAIYAHYALLVGAVVLIGIVIGEILGPLIVPALMNSKYSILYTLPEMATFTFPVLPGILTAVAFLGISALVTVLVARKTVRLLPSESLRPSTPTVKGKAKEGKKSPSARFLSFKIAMRNIRTQVVKSLMVIVGVAGCTALLVCGFGIEDTIDYGIETDIATYYTADLEVSYSLTQTASQIEAGFSGIEGIDAAVPVYTGTCEAYDSEGVSNDETFRIIGTENRFGLEIEEGTFAISEKVSEELGILEGDELTIVFGTEEVTARVCTVFQAFTANGIYALDDMEGLFAEGEEASYTTAFVYVSEGYDINEVGDSIISGYAAAVSYITHEEREEQINDIVSGIMILTNAVKVFAILLAIIVLFNLALLNFRERTRDIATLKVLGFSRGEIALSLLIESMTLTLCGVIIGLLAGYPFMYAVLAVNSVPLVAFLYHISPWTYVIAFVLTFFVSFLSNGYTSALTNRVKMVESLKSVE